VLTAEYLAEFYSVCECCGRTGYEGRTEDPVRDPECAVCLPLRIRVGRRDAEWILQYAMEKLGRLQRPGRVTFGSVTIDNVERASGPERERNVAEGVAALRRAATALSTPGVTLDLPPSMARYHSHPNADGRLIRVMNGEETTGTFENGTFKEDP
jgi:hypothetical protein